MTGLGARVCPECAREFDPADPESVVSEHDIARRKRLWRWLGWGAVVGSSWPLLLHAWLLLMLLVARLVLGRWPHRFGGDDPKSISLVREMHWVGMFAVLALPLMVLGGLVALAAVTALDWRMGVRRLILIIAVWAVLLVVGDPAQVGVWFMD